MNPSPYKHYFTVFAITTASSIVLYDRCPRAVGTGPVPASSGMGVSFDGFGNAIANTHRVLLCALAARSIGFPFGEVTE